MVTHLHYSRKYIGIALFVYLKLKCAIVYRSLMFETTK